MFMYFTHYAFYTFTYKKLCCWFIVFSNKHKILITF